MRFLRNVVLAVVLFTSVAAENPRLVLQITVDQLRGDLLPRYHARFGNGGFRRLLEQGIYYANAHYDAGNTFTSSGHAVLATGAATAEHGIVANEWWDRKSGRILYCTADPEHPIVGEADNTGAGMSPANLTSTTFGDELVLGSGSRSRAFAIAGKDRSAIIPGGHLGKAYWFSEVSGGFVTSTYYTPALPGWVQRWNDGKYWTRYRSLNWTPLYEVSSYRYAAKFENLYARPNPTLGRIFPHPLIAKSDALFFTALRFTPFLDEYTAAFAEKLIQEENVGHGQGTDYLSISFSATDYIGHAWGPNSVESEDNLLHLDRTLAELFAFIDRTVGLEHTLIVLSADHGVDDIPEDKRGLGYAAGRIYPDKLKDLANGYLKKRFAVEENLVAAFVPPGFYFDQARIAALRLESAAVEEALAQALRAVPGIAGAFTRSDLLAGRIGHTPILDKMQRAFHPTRSGDVVVLQSQFWYMYPDADAFAAMHGSPYESDTFVPILWLGHGLKPKISRKPVSPAEIAPTLAAALGIKSPSGCTQPELLMEVLAPAEGDPASSITFGQDGSVQLPAYSIPLSGYMSGEAKKRFIENTSHPTVLGSADMPIADIRARVDKYDEKFVQRGRAIYPVEIVEQTFAGVPTYIVSPKDGISPANRSRVLINLHGGAFSVGARFGGLIESIPIAAMAKIKVITIDYREGPENRFPAASADVAAVYREILKIYQSENVGIYGTSAGGFLTAEAVAWFQKEHLPRPGAIGLFCAGADVDSPGGDSRYTSALLNVTFGAPPVPDLRTDSPAEFSSWPYFRGTDLTNPLASPLHSLQVISQFPPTLVMSGSRDPFLSIAINTHAQMFKAGVVTELHVWEGMKHNFLYEMDLPESIDAYQVIVGFFAKHLGQR